jgi:hypothetical protein
MEKFVTKEPEETSRVITKRLVDIGLDYAMQQWQIHHGGGVLEAATARIKSKTETHLNYILDTLGYNDAAVVELTITPHFVGNTDFAIKVSFVS